MRTPGADCVSFFAISIENGSLETSKIKTDGTDASQIVYRNWFFKDLVTEEKYLRLMADCDRDY
jgi:hypothetical protein